jgi:hypothetical protein
MNGAKITRLKKSVILLGTAFAAFAAMPAYADSETRTGEAVIITPLSFISFEDLNFGQIIASGTPGTVVLAPNGTRTADNGIVLVGASHQRASFTGRGRRNQNVNISLASNSITVTNPAGNTMTVGTFTIGSTPSVVLTTTPRRFRIASTNGIFVFNVGASLAVGANQAPGIYTGDWDITLDYQ